MDLIEKVFHAMAAAEQRTQEGLARAAVTAVFDVVESHMSAVQYDPAPYTAMKYRLSTLRREALGDE